MMVRYLLDAGVEARVPGVAGPQTGFSGVVEPVSVALEQERRVSEQIAALAALAREEGDLLSEQFLQWFLREQVEEVASLSDLFRVVQRGQDNPLMVEEYLARERPGEGEPDPTAPPVAGGAL